MEKFEDEEKKLDYGEGDRSNPRLGKLLHWRRETWERTSAE
jgi:hypothetical protein